MIPTAILCMFMHIPALHTFYCVLGLLFYSIYLIVDTMRICKDKCSQYGDISFDYDDYIIGALMLYIDIVMIFVYILQLMGRKD